MDFIRRALKGFEQAVEMEENARRAWLARERLSDPALVTEVERLLHADAQGLHALPTGGLYASPAPPPERIGHYRIIERIGGGGMGEVFVGARADGLFDHHVAIKRMRPSPLPEAAAALFDKERRALARQSHRNIAQLFDGGVDEAGAPYLIMELVRGVSIERHAADRDETVRGIAALIATVCDGVQHAHQQLIVHADLKPANILVNAAGDAKIVDFGVARILHEMDSLEDGGVYPQTPAYASPQRRCGAPPSPADDVYSLGVILKELLTGSQVAATDRHARPSETLRAHTPEGRSLDWAMRRAKECSGDLDDIVARACAEAVEERYLSAGEMAEDLRAWLEYRPLKARRGDWPYVLAKFARRRRLRVIGGVIAAAGLLVSLATVSILYTQADAARRKSEQRFEQVRGLAGYMLHDVYDRLEATPRTLALRHDLARMAQGYLDALTRDSSSPVDVKRDAVEGFVRLAELQAGRRASNLGRPAEAIATLDKAETLLEELGREHGLDEQDVQQQVRINLLRAMLAANAEQALDVADRRLAAARQKLAKLPDSPDRRRFEVRAALEAADLANWSSEYDQGIAAANAGLAKLSALAAEDQDSGEMREAELLLRTLRGDSHYYLGRPKEAASEYRDVVARADAWRAEQPDSMRAIRHVIVARWNLGTTLLSLGEAKAALVLLEQAAALVPQLTNFEPSDDNVMRTESITNLAYAQALAANGQIERGFNNLRSQVERRKQRHTADPEVPEYARSYAIALGALGDMLAENGRATEACNVLAQADAVFEGLQRRNRLASFDTSVGGWTLVKESIEKYCGDPEVAAAGPSPF